MKNFRKIFLNFRFKLKARYKFFIGERIFDEEDFLNRWSEKFEKSHEPQTIEVVSRITSLGRDVICEIGAGYGRVLQSFPSAFTRIALEPSELLWSALKIGDIQAHNLPARKLPGNLNVGLFFSVRAMHYCSSYELFKLLIRMRKFYPHALFIVWERRQTCNRMRLINFFVRQKNVYYSEIVN